MLSTTQIAELRLAIISSRAAAKTYEEFCEYLEKNYNVKALEIADVLFYLHPEAGNKLMDAKSLGDNYTKDAIINNLGKPLNDGKNLKNCSEAEELEYYKRLYQEIFAYNPSNSQEQSNSRNSSEKFTVVIHPADPDKK